MTGTTNTELLDRVARAMCDGNWDAASFNETANGESPEEQRDYWRDKARIALTAATPDGLSATLLGALEPFAKAGRLFSDVVPEGGYVESIYSPAAGSEYNINGDHLRAARDAVDLARSAQASEGAGR